MAHGASSPVHISNVCRANLPAQVLELIDQTGIIPIPEDMLEPRQIKITSQDVQVPAHLKFHRDAFITVISPQAAVWLVEQAKAEYMPQSLLVYSMLDYLEDSDVKNDPEEYNAAQESMAEFVLVAVVGDNRSTLSACRNIVSAIDDWRTTGTRNRSDRFADHHYEEERLIQQILDQAKGAIESQKVFLIEE